MVDIDGSAHHEGMHPIQMETLAQQRWDELVAQGAAARANHTRRRAARARSVGPVSALVGLLARRPVGRAPGRKRRAGQVATLP